MTLIQKSVTINAPVENVLAILEDPERQSELEGEPGNHSKPGADTLSFSSVIYT